ncbi:MAG: zinc-ribbon domain-containing protein [Candidatus Eisenbacteria bacterium]|nr:zinc-ribbon domain-containing protein [Candidatus Eisenbacteria bacterium]
MSDNHDLDARPPMTVHCPHCATGYLIPDALVGTRGARVRCPTCSGSFVVLPENGNGAHAPGGPRRGDAPRAREAEAAAPDPGEVAATLLDGLASALGPELDTARAGGRLLGRHGPAILDAYDEYRRRTHGADAEPFLHAIRDRWGVDLAAPR